MDEGTGRAGRVRKKSAKVLEMEEFEKIEKKDTKKTGKPKASPIKKGRKSSGGLSGDEDTMASIDADLAAIQESPLPAIPEVKVEKKSKAHMMGGDVPDMPPSKAELAAIKQATAKQSTQKQTPAKPKGSKASKAAAKTPKAPAMVEEVTEFEVAIETEIPLVEDIAMEEEVSTETSNNVSVESANSSGVTETVKPAKGQRRSKKRAAAETPSEQPTPAAKRKRKKKSSVEEEVIEEIVEEAMMSESESKIYSDSEELEEEENIIGDLDEDDLSTDDFSEEEEDELVINIETSKKRQGKKKFKKESSSDSMDNDLVPNVHSSPEGLPLYSNTDAMAKRYMTFAERKAANKTVPKKKEEEKKPGKKRAATGYMMFCSANRPKIMKDRPHLEFAEISRLLGDMWNSLSEKDKMGWRRKAKKEAKKKQESEMQEALVRSKAPEYTIVKPNKPKPQRPASPLKGAPNKGGPSKGSATPSPRSTEGGGLKTMGVNTNLSNTSVIETLKQELANTTFKVTSCKSLDMAAHLKLLGESLSVIGARLQEHQGPIAVQGSLSVLLDSMVCALGPLISLTTQVSELNGCNIKTHSDTMDNIAYIMPGIG